MKGHVFLSVILLGLITGAIAQNAPSKSPLREMVETEHAFAKMSEDSGTREAFMEFIAEDGILFRPRAVAGKQWMRDHPAPASDKRPLLSWQPVFAEVAGSGDMGYTTGPWELKNDINDPTPAAFGAFITVWKKQADGSWKFAIDLGVSHPQSSGPLKIWQPPDTPSRSVRKVDAGTAKSHLLDRDVAFKNAALRNGVVSAFNRFAASDVRMYREGSLPIIGKQAARQKLAASTDVFESQMWGSGVSNDGDLGYTYGTYETRSRDAAKKITGQGNFLRIWQRRGGLLQLVLDVNSPLQQ